MTKRSADQRGYAMAALLVAMAVMAVMVSVLLPVWSTLAKREKEAEFFFRAEQYGQAIREFQKKYAGANPPNIDVLITEKLLRKKYKDPITGDDFVLVTAAGQAQAGQAGRAGGGGGIIGVTSKSTDKMLRIYNGLDTYNKVIIMGTQQSNRPGGTPGGAPGGTGGPAGRTGGPGAGNRGGGISLTPPAGRGIRPPVER